MYKWQELKNIQYVSDLNKYVEEGWATSLINVAEAVQEKELSRIADMIAQRGTVRVVLIAGPSSSGKTTTSKRLSISLVAHNVWPVSISMDDYYCDREKTPRDEKGDYDYESLYALDLEMFQNNLSDLIAGKEVELPHYNFHTGASEKSGHKLTLEKNEVLVIEGIHALNPELVSHIPPEQVFRVFAAPMTETPVSLTLSIPPTANRLLRRIIRDYKYRGTSAEDTIKRWPKVRAGEKKWILPFRGNADASFDTLMNFEPAVFREQAEPILAAVPEGTPEYDTAQELLVLVRSFTPIPAKNVPFNSILREFLGGSSFEY